MNFLNSGKGWSCFWREARKPTYVDKSMLIDVLYRYSQDVNHCICLTRPRRFGKSAAANMIAAFFDERSGEKCREVFLRLRIGQLKEEQERAFALDETLPLCWPLQGQCKVIRINMIDLVTDKTHSFQDYMDTLNRRMLEDIREMYPTLSIRESMSIPEILEKTEDRFIFVIDELDMIFEMPFVSEKDQKSYILFLKALLKDKSYVHFAYMTGILPIAKYSSGSPLNMFKEFSTFSDNMFYAYFGFTREEIQEVMQRKGYLKPPMEDLAFWYDGYLRSFDGVHMYNPTSVSEALAEGICQSHWTGTGPMHEVQDLIRRNVKDLREDVIRMTGGEAIAIELSGFSTEKRQIQTKDEILSAMVVYGFLTYYDKQLRIPNHELTLEFRRALAAEPLGLKQTLETSEKLLRATLMRDDAQIAQRIEALHDEQIPFFQYHDENSLACVIVMGYIAALDSYQILREDKAGKGYADFTFTPLRKEDIPIILELKYNHSAAAALESIHRRGYLSKFKDYDKVLLVGINYSEATKQHTCLTEMVVQHA